MTDTPTTDPAPSEAPVVDPTVAPEQTVDPTVTPSSVPPVSSPTPPDATVPDPASTVSEDEPADAATQVAPVFTPTEVTPAASETPVPADTTPAVDPSAPLIPTNGSFGDSREIAAAEALGLDTPAGKALSSASREVLRGIESSLQGIESWVAYVRKIVASLPES